MFAQGLGLTFTGYALRSDWGDQKTRGLIFSFPTAQNSAKYMSSLQTSTILRNIPSKIMHYTHQGLGLTLGEY